MHTDHDLHGGMGFDPAPLWLLLTIALAVAYVAATVIQRRAGHGWPWWKQLFWYVGLASLLVSTWGPWATKAGNLLSWHMAQHMMLSMITPIALILGQPISLALRTLTLLGSRGRGARRVLLRVLHSRVMGFIVHPVVASVFFVASLYAMYFTPLLDWLMRSHVGHHVMLLHFLLVGLQYFTPLLAVEPLRHKHSPPARLFAMVFAVPFHAFFAVIIMGAGSVLSQHFATQTLARGIDPLADQYLAGGIAWVLGEVPLLAMVAVVGVQWVRHDRRLAARTDRHARRSDDRELAAYNQRLAELAALHDRHGASERSAGRQ